MKSGTCLGEQYCREVVETDVPVRCVYSDGSEYFDGPPPSTVCPSPADDRTPFCGGACGACPYLDPEFYSGEWATSCVGVNEERELGVCSFGRYACTPGQPFAARECDGPGRRGVPCACLVLRGPDGTFPEWGFPTFAEPCRAYRDRYGEDVR